MKDSRSFIRKYKNALIGLLLIVFGVFIIFQVILPQIDQMKIKNAEIEKEEKKVDALKKTIQVLASIQESDLDHYFNLSQTALPQFKDILSIFNELSNAAQKNDIELDDLRINLGPVYSKDKSDIKADIDSQNANKSTFFGSSVVSFEVNVDGDISNLRSFSQALYGSTPVVEVKGIKASRNSGVLEANFFYNPFSESTANTDVPAQPFSPEELELIKRIEEWVENSKSEDINDSQTLQVSPSPSPSVSVKPTVAPTIKPLL